MWLTKLPFNFIAFHSVYFDHRLSYAQPRKCERERKLLNRTYKCTQILYCFICSVLLLLMQSANHGITTSAACPVRCTSSIIKWIHDSTQMCIYLILCFCVISYCSLAFWVLYSFASHHHQQHRISFLCWFTWIIQKVEFSKNCFLPIQSLLWCLWLCMGARR